MNNLMILADELLIAPAPDVTTAMTQSEVIENSLLLMGQGMGGIFVVMAAISLIVWGITKFSK